jgi:hypothetical protein
MDDLITLLCMELIIVMIALYLIFSNSKKQIRRIKENIKHIVKRIKENIMALFKSKETLKISPNDRVDGYLSDKIRAGENISLDIHEHEAYGSQIIVSSNKTTNRKVIKVTQDTVVEADVHLVLVDSTNNPVNITLPVAHDYNGDLSIVCVGMVHPIILLPNASTQNIIFDTSNIEFKAKGDSLVFVSDMENSEENPGAWYCVSRYYAVWY